MINVFDITEFGAVGDGETDCTGAVQNALDAAAGCMGRVIVPPGRYLVDGDLQMRGCGVSLEGTAAWSYRSDGASVFILNNENAACMLDISGAFGCTVRGMSLNGKRLGQGVHGIRLCWPAYNGGGQEDTPTIDDCRIGSFSGDGLHFEKIWCFSVRHSMLYYNGGAGLKLAGWDAFILDNWFANNDGGAIRSCGYVASVTATGNRVEWNKQGGFMIDRGDSFNFTGNFFDRTFGPALKLGDGEGEVNLASITGNVFRRSGAYAEKPHEDAELNSHILMNRCSGCVVTGNTCKVGAGDGGIPPVSPNWGFIVKNCVDTIVKDNAMHNGSLNGNLIETDNSGCLIEQHIGGTFQA